MNVKVKKADFFDTIQRWTENYLTRRAARRKIKLEKQRKKNPVIDWIEAFIWAACVVLLINQYLFQAYQIPSGSMVDTLLVGDRIFVNKIVYGPELLPGILKIPSPFKPQRNQVIIFENPSYISRGTVFDVAQRIIYMLTLSIVDIDRDEQGNPKAHFLIKRAVGKGGDTFINKNGDMQIRFSGETRLVMETEYNESRGWKHKINRLVKPDDYPALLAAGYAAALQDMGVNVPEKTVALAKSSASIINPDYITFETERLVTLRGAFPHETRFSEQYARRIQGWYVPPGRILPLGDNRDNSRDGRFFGAVKLDKVLGKGSFKYWPFRRIGTIK